MVNYTILYLITRRIMSANRIDDLNIKMVGLHKKIAEQGITLKYILSKLGDIDAALSTPTPSPTYSPRKSTKPHKRPHPTRSARRHARRHNPYNPLERSRSRSRNDDSSTTATSNDAESSPSSGEISRVNATDIYELDSPTYDLLPVITPQHHRGRRRPSKTVGAISDSVPYRTPISGRLGYSTAKPHNAEIPTQVNPRTSTSVQAPVYTHI